LQPGSEGDDVEIRIAGDALVVAAALRGGCTRLYSEDMQDGMGIEGQMQISNPFRTER
jgi:predicted nucleic acid-binding protein